MDYKSYFRYPSYIKIGDRVSINRGCKFIPGYGDPSKGIEISNDVIIGPECVFFGTAQDHNYANFPNLADKIVIEDHVYIGGKTTVLKNVTIGKYSVVGAGAVVTKDIPPFSIAVGVPARVIKKRIIKDRNGSKA